MTTCLMARLLESVVLDMHAIPSFSSDMFFEVTAMFANCGSYSIVFGNFFVCT